MPTSRRRSAAVTVGVVALAATLTGCGADYTGVCTDKKTNTRLADKDCDDGNSGYVGGAHGWYYIRGGNAAPAVGAPVSGGSFTVPNGASTAKGGVSAKGGTVAKGGFTGWAGSVGG